MFPNCLPVACGGAYSSTSLTLALFFVFESMLSVDSFRTRIPFKSLSLCMPTVGSWFTVDEPPVFSMPFAYWRDTISELFF